MVSVLIVGGGNLGFAHAAFCKRNGFSTMIWADPNHRTLFDKMAEAGPVKYAGFDDGVDQGAVSVVFATDLSSAVQNCEVIVVTLPSDGHQAFLERLRGYNLSGHTVIVEPGNGFTSHARNILSEDLFPALIVETTTSPWACRVVDCTVKVLGTKRKIEMAGHVKPTEIQLDAIGKLFNQQIEWYGDLASIVFANVNATTHPPLALAMKPYLGQKLRFYWDGFPLAEERYLALDNERIKIAEALDLKTDTDFGYSCGWYGPYPDVKTFYTTFPGYEEVMAPKTLNHRYLTEDVADGLVTMWEAAVRLNVKVPVMLSVIVESGEILERDLIKEGGKLAHLALDASASDIISVFNGK